MGLSNQQSDSQNKVKGEEEADKREPQPRSLLGAPRRSGSRNRRCSSF